MRQPATPLQLIALGLMVVFLDALEGRDPLPDPIGWLIVLVGTTRLPLPRQRTITALAALCLAVSVPLWFPELREPVFGADESLAWVTELPEFALVILLCRDLMAAARPLDQRGYVRFGTLSALFGALVLVPPIGIAGDLEWLLVSGTIVLQACQIWLVWSLFSHHARPWAKPPATAPNSA